MPPKRKNTQKIKKTKKKADDGADELVLKYKSSVLDAEVLRDHLALRCDAVRQAQVVSSDLRSRVRDMEHKLHYEKQDRRDVSADVSRQYESMQTELTAKVTRLEEKVRLLTQQLARCQEELRTEAANREQMQQEKDGTIAELQSRLDNMENDYEKILHDSLDSLSSQLEGARQGWEEQSTGLHQEYKDMLSEFGLNSLDI